MSQSLAKQLISGLAESRAQWQTLVGLPWCKRRHHLKALGLAASRGLILSAKARLVKAQVYEGPGFEGPLRSCLQGRVRQIKFRSFLCGSLNSRDLQTDLRLNFDG